MAKNKHYYNLKENPVEDEQIKFLHFDPEGNEYWEVEKILDKKYDPSSGEDKYLVKWKGFGEDSNTWEPVDNLETVYDIVEEFENNLRAKKKGAKSKKAAEKVVERTSPESSKPKKSEEPPQTRNRGGSKSMEKPSKSQEKKMVIEEPATNNKSDINKALAVPLGEEFSDGEFSIKKKGATNKDREEKAIESTKTTINSPVNNTIESKPIGAASNLPQPILQNNKSQPKTTTPQGPNTQIPPEKTVMNQFSFQPTRKEPSDKPQEAPIVKPVLSRSPIEVPPDGSILGTLFERSPNSFSLSPVKQQTPSLFTGSPLAETFGFVKPMEREQNKGKKDDALSTMFDDLDKIEEEVMADDLLMKRGNSSFIEKKSDNLLDAKKPRTSEPPKVELIIDDDEEERSKGAAKGGVDKDKDKDKKKDAVSSKEKGHKKATPDSPKLKKRTSEYGRDKEKERKKSRDRHDKDKERENKEKQRTKDREREREQREREKEREQRERERERIQKEKEREKERERERERDKDREKKEKEKEKERQKIAQEKTKELLEKGEPSLSRRDSIGAPKPRLEKTQSVQSVEETTGNKNGMVIEEQKTTTQKRRAVFKKTLFSKNPLKKDISLDGKAYYKSIVEDYLDRRMDRQTFLEMLCPEGNFKDDQIQDIRCLSWEGRASMEPENYYFQIVWKPRANGVQMGSRYASWKEILEESPKEAAEFVFQKLVTIVSKYGTFGEY